MQLTKPTTKHLKQIMAWISSEQELLQWAGPDFRFPYDLDSFSEDLKLAKLNSYCLLSNESELLAFGQFYLRLGKCHLGRLIVNPDRRGQGVAKLLIEKLSEKGCAELEVEDCSLFVLDNNQSALRVYEKMGFQLAQYPKKLLLPHCLYMIKEK
jgi:ribosomal protein S18 acetylase RimI-like enzyme